MDSDHQQQTATFFMHMYNTKTYKCNILEKMLTIIEIKKSLKIICNTGLDGCEDVPEVKAGSEQVFKHVDEIERRNFGDWITSVHSAHYVHTTVLVHSNQHTTYTQYITRTINGTKLYSK